MSIYKQNYYENRHQQTVYAANTIISLLTNCLPGLNSAIDVGCGVGTWLAVIREKGVEDIQGIDGIWVDENLLVIPKGSFLKSDLTLPIELNRRFDLAITLEVAEHLPISCAKTFVTSLTKLSDFVLFSAAIPLQPGRNHVNCQWPEYWVEQFSNHGYSALDFVRKKIWNDNKIQVWYRQNTLFFVKKERLKDLKMAGDYVFSNSEPFSRVHPDTYLAMTTLKGSRYLFARAIKSWFAQKFGIGLKNNVSK